ncbi:unnamed protein product [Paramecium sonneborni]|uniref:Uncharacterized protein n=1 Tax=Paramecium sonneborni TaxID=65129 RepID=A0A8S1KDY1_9CILI|nr:unnamed protein product [Paramecium sonneborni]
MKLIFQFFLNWHLQDIISQGYHNYYYPDKNAINYFENNLFKVKLMNLANKQLQNQIVCDMQICKN